MTPASASLPPATDVNELARRAGNGDTEAFAELVRAFQRRLWRIAVHWLADRALAESVVQQAFLNAWAHLGQYQVGRDFEAWLSTILRNLVRQELRRQGRESGRLVHYRAYLEAVLLTDDAEEGARRGKLEEALRACREELAPLASRVVEMRYSEGLRAEDIARVIGRTELATRQLLFRVRAALRGCVEHRLEAG